MAHAMTPEQERVLKQAREYRAYGTLHELDIAIDALVESEKPVPVTFPDPPTNRKAWQRGGPFGETTHREPHRNVRDQFRELRVTYTPMDEPSPAERITQLGEQVAICQSQWLDERNRVRELEAANGELVQKIVHLLNRIAELEAALATAKDQAAHHGPCRGLPFDDVDAPDLTNIKFVSMPQPDDDSDLLWGVQYTMKDGFTYHSTPNEEEARAAVYASRVCGDRKLVRLRVIEVPETNLQDCAG